MLESRVNEVGFNQNNPNFQGVIFEAPYFTYVCDMKWVKTKKRMQYSIAQLEWRENKTEKRIYL